MLAAVLLLLVREDSGLVLFFGALGLVRQPGARWSGVSLMALFPVGAAGDRMDPTGG